MRRAIPESPSALMAQCISQWEILLRMVKVSLSKPTGQLSGEDI
jgi:hypothetical protein